MSFWGTLGKTALKIAPIAAAFIPGVGPLAAAAIGAGTSAASSKLSGDSWGKAALAGGIGGLGSYGLDKAVGIGNAAKTLGTTARSAGKTGLFSQMGMAPGVGSVSTGGLASTAAKGIAPGLSTTQKILATLPPAIGAAGAIASMKGGGNSEQDYGYGTGPGRPGYDSNFGAALNSGRMEALMNQPWRISPMDESGNLIRPDIFPNHVVYGIGPSYDPGLSDYNQLYQPKQRYPYPTQTTAVPRNTGISPSAGWARGFNKIGGMNAQEGYDPLTGQRPGIY